MPEVRLDCTLSCEWPNITEVVALVSKKDIKKGKKYTVSGFINGNVMIVGSGFQYPLGWFKIA